MKIIKGGSMANVEELELPARISEEAACAMLLDAEAVAIRDVDAGEEPFLYSSGNFGPGYVMVKGLVARQDVFKPLVDQVALKAIDEGVEFDHVAGNATGGMVPAYGFREAYQGFTGRKDIEYVYVRGTRKEGGHKELVTGLDHISPTREDGTPTQILVMEELVNFAQTTTNSLNLFRGLGFVADKAATILYYDHDAARARIAENNVDLTYLTTLPNLLEVAVNEGFYSIDAVASYREFLADPAAWQAARGIEPVEQG